MVETGFQRYWELITLFNKTKKSVYLEMIMRLPGGSVLFEAQRQKVMALRAAS